MKNVRFIGRIIARLIWVLLILAVLAFATFPTAVMVSASETRSLRLTPKCEAVIFTTQIPKLFGFDGLTLPRNGEGDSMILVHQFNEGLTKHEVQHSRQICRMANHENMNWWDMFVYYLHNSEKLEDEADSVREMPLRHLPPTPWNDS